MIGKLLYSQITTLQSISVTNSFVNLLTRTGMSLLPRKVLLSNFLCYKEPEVLTDTI